MVLITEYQRFKTLEKAVKYIEVRLKAIDEFNNEHHEEDGMPVFKNGKNYNSMESKNMHDNLYLVYNVFDDDTYFVFEDESMIFQWLEEEWIDWNMGECPDAHEHYENNIVVINYFRNICKEIWTSLYSNSEEFIEGWSSRRQIVELELVPSFTLN